MNTLKFIEIKDNSECNKKVKKLYYEAFPKNERAPFSLMKRFAKGNKADFFGVYDNDIFVGLVYNIYYKDIVYVYYLAIEKSLRGKGYGSGVLESIKEKYTMQRVILMAEETDADSTNYKERMKRKEFYYGNGFRELNYKVKEAGVMYDMLSCNGEGQEVNRDEYFDLMRNYWGDFLYRHVYVRISKM